MNISFRGVALLLEKAIEFSHEREKSNRRKNLARPKAKVLEKLG